MKIIRVETLVIKILGGHKKLLKAMKSYTSFNFEGACGIILPEKIMKKIAKHLAKYTDEVKKILYEKKMIYTNITGR
jgi:xanthine dehydrogenase molybdopterin-binding subunit B